MKNLEKLCPYLIKSGQANEYNEIKHNRRRSRNIWSLFDQIMGGQVRSNQTVKILKYLGFSWSSQTRLVNWNKKGESLGIFKVYLVTPSQVGPGSENLETFSPYLIKSRQVNEHQNSGHQKSWSTYLKFIWSNHVRSSLNYLWFSWLGQVR